MKRGMKKFATGMYAAALLALLSGCASTPKETIISSTQGSPRGRGEPVGQLGSVPLQGQSH